MTYGEQLKDPRWLEKRKEILRRDGFKCVCCNISDVKLNVHHGIYFKYTMAWEYADEYLHTLCDPCHERTHFFIDSIQKKLGKLNPMLLWDVEFVLIAMDFKRSKEFLKLAIEIIREG
jgi:hypothetical protein